MPDHAAPYVEDDELRIHVEQALSDTYEVEQEIGRGGMGIVYRARDKRLKRHVAIKLLPPELSFRRDIRTRFLREAETAAQLSHPNIVPIYSVGEVGKLVFFVMACIDGDNLAVRLHKRGPCPPEDVRRWLMEVGDALSYAHSRGVIHRDIKPDNILLDGVEGRAMVTDFGIARAAVESGETSRLTATGIAIGTPAYMSPEQASGDRDLDARSDLYSLGIVAYQMLVGEPPFVGNTTPALLVKHLAEVPVPITNRRADVPPELSAIVMRLLEKSPDRRFQSGDDLVSSLRSGIVPPTPVPPPNTAANSSRSRIGLTGEPIGGMQLPSYGKADLSVGSAPYRQTTQFAPATSYDRGSAQDRSNTSSGLAATVSPESIARWEHAPVRAFRKKLVLYLFVNTAILVVGIFGGGQMLGFSTLWTVYIAWKYAKLWSDGYDWRDVLRQPEDRVFGEVISDVVDSIMATFSSKKREELKAQGKQNRLKGALSPRSPSSALQSGSKSRADSGAPVRVENLGRYADAVRSAHRERDEILRLLNTIPSAERAEIPGVEQTAVELVRTIELIANDLATSDVSDGSSNLQEIDAEIASLEAQANPLEVERSETRVRRLAQLRRDRRATLAVGQRLETRPRAAEKLWRGTRERTNRPGQTSYGQQLGRKRHVDCRAGHGTRA